ncbi:MAG: hypothetical protein ACK5LM_06520 [Lactovum sp.]
MKRFIISIIVGITIAVIIISMTITWWFAVKTIELNVQYTIKLAIIPIMDVIKLSANNTVKTINLLGTSLVGGISWAFVYAAMSLLKKEK